MSRPTFQAVLFVDGYNMIGAWPDLKHTRDRLGLEEARHQLAHILMGYSAYQRYDTQVVFDAHFQGRPGSQEKLSSQLTLQYTNYRQTADTYIEKACAAFRHDLRRFEQRLIVATSDRAQRLTVVGYGAECLSAERLLSEVEQMNCRVRQRQRSKRQSTPRRTLSSRIDPKSQAKLASLRLSLSTKPTP